MFPDPKSLDPDEPLPIDKGFRRLPGFHLDGDEEPMFGNNRMGESWDITHRDFKTVDACFGGKISATLDQRRKNGIVPISILDVGGGIESTTSRDLATTYAEAVLVTNLDVILAESISNTANLKAVLGDATNMPFDDQSFDIVYSWQVLFRLKPERREQALVEIARLLKPKGVAFVDEPDYCFLPADSGHIVNLSKKLGVHASLEPGTRKVYWPHETSFNLVFRKPEALKN